MDREVGTPKIVLDGVIKVYKTAGDDVLAVDNVSLQVGDGEFLAVIGPSGCGKSTLLRIIAGLHEPTAGRSEIVRHGTGASNAMVFQDYALFPWRTVLDNVAFGLENAGVPKVERHRIADGFLERVGLSEFRLAYPHQLSGGMKQRAGIARALAVDPEVLLMDEPLGALDAQIRLLLQELLLEVWEEHRKTVVYVTHSLEEAVLLADRVVVFTARPGRIKAIIDIDLPRPRSLDLRSSPQFNALQERLWHLLRDEVQAAAGGERKRA